MTQSSFEYRQSRMLPDLVCIGLVVMVFILRPATLLDQKNYLVYQSYGADILVPFAFYFILDLAAANVLFLRKWYAKLLLVILGASASEIFQALGIYAFGSTFDFLDFLMYLLGGLLAVVFDRLIFHRLIKNWQ